MAQPGFMLYVDDWLTYIEDYDTTEIGEMLKALLAYFLTGETAEFTDRGMRQFFRQAAKAIEFDRKRYDDKCLQNAYNRYRGTCKRNDTQPMSFEEWSTTVDDRQQMSTTDNGSFSIPTTNSQLSNTNSQLSVCSYQASASDNQISEKMQEETQFEQKRENALKAIRGFTI